ncbi:MAG: hypothetical protein R3B45_14990 [Bdellovibrionota bacterium]
MVFFYQKNGQTFNSWDGQFSSLKPMYENIELNEMQSYNIFSGKFGDLTGNFKLYYGYKANGYKHDMFISYNRTSDISFSIVK